MHSLSGINACLPGSALEQKRYFVPTGRNQDVGRAGLNIMKRIQVVVFCLWKGDCTVFLITICPRDGYLFAFWAMGRRPKGHLNAFWWIERHCRGYFIIFSCNRKAPTVHWKPNPCPRGPITPLACTPAFTSGYVISMTELCDFSTSWL